MTEQWFEVDETIEVVSGEGEPIGRLRPGKRYRALAVGPIQVDVAGPNETVGHIPRAAITLLVTSEASQPSPPPAPPPPPPNPPAPPPKAPPAPQPAATHAPPESAPSARSSKRGPLLLVAVVVLVLLGAGGAFAFYQSQQEPQLRAGWWLHEHGSGRYFDDPALDLSIRLVEGGVLDEGLLLFDDGQTCLTAEFARPSSKSFGRWFSVTGSGERCDGTPLTVELTGTAQDDGTISGRYTVLVEGESGSSAEQDGWFTLARTGDENSGDPFGTDQPSDDPGEPPGAPTVQRVARFTEGLYDEAPSVGSPVVSVCFGGVVDYRSTRTIDGEKITSTGNTRVSASGEGEIEITSVGPDGGTETSTVSIFVESTFVGVLADGLETRLAFVEDEDATACEP